MSLPLLRIINNADELDDYLMAMNEAGIEPNLPFVDANGNANMAMGQAPSGDDWQVGFVAQDPDSGMLGHCCECYEHDPRTECDINWDWEPAYPLVGLVKDGAP